MGKILLLFLLVSLSGSHVMARAPLDKAGFIEHLLGQMTVAEKVGQLELIGIDRERTGASIREGIASGLVGGISGTPSPPYGWALQQVAMERSRLKIPLFFAADVIHGLHTIFPVSLALAASWDLSAIALAGRISAQEASAEGVHLTFGPSVDITRDPRWGRVSEGYGEDPFLASRIAGVMVKAYRGDDPRTTDSLKAGIKHFALYGAVEGGKDYNSVDMSTANMYQFYFAPYRAAVEAGAGMAMIAFNTIDGVPAAANRWLIKDVLRQAWGFDGVTLGDCRAIEGLVFHGVARDVRQAAALAVRSGVDMELCDDAYARYLPGLVASGEVDVGVLDEAVRNVLGLKYDLGLFDNPYRNLNRTELPPIATRLQRDAARDIARKTFVLLKNAHQTLPLNKQDSIALIGPFAKSRRDLLGSYCGDCDERNVVSIYEGLARAVEGKAPLLYAKGANFTTDTQLSERLKHYNTPLDLDSRSPEALLDEALEVARRAKVIVAVVGEPWSVNDESISRARINLPASQRRLLSTLKSLNKPLVIVLVNGRPLDLTREQAQADALLETWFSGTEGGNAVADVLFGDYNPSGKLPMTFPRSVGQIPLYYNHLNTGRPFDSAAPWKYMSQYIDEPDGPLYPFGYGLSYTRFELSDLQLSTSVLRVGEQLKARITLANAGPRDGETVVQLYIRDLVASVSRPVKELKGFEKIMLKAGERRIIEFTLDENDLKFYNAQLDYVAEPGEFKVQIGLDSQDVQEQSFELR
ncbi:beta-glucosidase BglX [Pseudomonas sp. CBSPBW29]|uniref:beta-glucosidase BglX n=1 Tax=Pseudomonas TaxID=286 RepID=UPI0021AC1CD3|nr:MULTISPECIES: beta-glucosidase BglX [unclassified Pseudomonas]WEL42388.1 beta-glucosidase BglX [Pseudomonas sp. CBSPBW29]WEL72648.1 beta-glucosidase BglX [Pseudomonas sp. CBSPCGW29]WEL73959.1 beta-glucosidase BglX [Pseudomonas sp. CBSPAW29]WEL81800.1 beta-glucosidase BglX [Pseudomonas sp. CBSPCAW29]WEL90279.1 beta-glucosidase BglX [Pseudomonas sp. CBSPCBW29]